MDLRILAVLSKTYQPYQIFRRLVSGRQLLFLTSKEGHPVAAIIGVREYDGNIDGNVFIRKHRTDHKGLDILIWKNIEFRSFHEKTLQSDLIKLVRNVGS
jgi:hypothetical protein